MKAWIRDGSANHTKIDFISYRFWVDKKRKTIRIRKFSWWDDENDDDDEFAVCVIVKGMTDEAEEEDEVENRKRNTYKNEN